MTEPNAYGDNFSQNLTLYIGRAKEHAKEKLSYNVTPAHILYVLFESLDNEVFGKEGTEKGENFLKDLQELVSRHSSRHTAYYADLDIPLSPQTEVLLEKYREQGSTMSVKMAIAMLHDFDGIEDIKELLNKHSLTKEHLVPYDIGGAFKLSSYTEVYEGESMKDENETEKDEHADAIAILNQLPLELTRFFSFARAKTMNSGHSNVTLAHLLFEFSSYEGMDKVLEKLDQGQTVPELQTELQMLIAHQNESHYPNLPLDQVLFDEEVRLFLWSLDELLINTGLKNIKPETILSLFHDAESKTKNPDQETVSQFLDRFSLTREFLNSNLQAMGRSKKGQKEKPVNRSNERYKSEAFSKSSGKAEKKKRKKTPALDSFSISLTDLAEDNLLDPVIGREEEIDRTIEILCGRNKSNPLLLGEAGVGKTAIAEGLAQRILEGCVPELLQDKRVVTLDLGLMVAGTKYRGTFEDRLKSVLAEAQRTEGVIIFIDELHTLLGAGGAEGALDAANLLKPALARGDIQVIGATTLDEYRRHIEKDSAISRRFQNIIVEPPTVEESIQILHGLSSKYEGHFGISYEDTVLDQVPALAKRYMQDRHLPDSAVDVINTAGSHAMLAGQKSITIDDVYYAVSSFSGVPVGAMSVDEKTKVIELPEHMNEDVIGRKEEIDAIVDVLIESRSGLKEDNKPEGCFILAGPTGTGKTLLAQKLADHTDRELIRIDMSEYMEKHNVSGLIGAPPGYVGFEDQEGKLSGAVRRKPHSVLLLDEIDKAHPDVFNILLQVLDDGHLTDNHGRSISFEDTIILMTSNAGVEVLLEPGLGFAHLEEKKGTLDPKIREAMKEAVAARFKPEFMNRVDDVLVFKTLLPEEMRVITDLELDSMSARMQKKGITLEVDDQARAYLAQKGYDPQFNARPLKRLLREKIQQPAAKELLTGALQNGGVVKVTFNAASNETKGKRLRGELQVSFEGAANDNVDQRPNSKETIIKKSRSSRRSPG